MAFLSWAEGHLIHSLLIFPNDSITLLVNFTTAPSLMPNFVAIWPTEEAFPKVPKLYKATANCSGTGSCDELKTG